MATLSNSLQSVVVHAGDGIQSTRATLQRVCTTGFTVTPQEMTPTSRHRQTGSVTFLIDEESDVGEVELEDRHRQERPHPELREQKTVDLFPGYERDTERRETFACDGIWPPVTKLRTETQDSELRAALRDMSDIAAGPFGKRSPRSRFFTALHGALGIGCLFNAAQFSEHNGNWKQCLMGLCYSAGFIVVGMMLPTLVWRIVPCREARVLLTFAHRARRVKYSPSPLQALELQDDLLGGSSSALDTHLLESTLDLDRMSPEGQTRMDTFNARSLLAASLVWPLLELVAVLVPFLQWSYAAEHNYESGSHSVPAFHCFMIWFLGFLFFSVGLIEGTFLAAIERCVDALCIEAASKNVQWAQFFWQYRRLHGAMDRLWSLKLLGGFCACRMACLVTANVLLLFAGLGDFDRDLIYSFFAYALLCGLIAYGQLWRMAMVTVRCSGTKLRDKSLTSVVLDRGALDHGPVYQNVISMLKMRPMQVAIAGSPITRKLAREVGLRMMLYAPAMQAFVRKLTKP